MTLAKCGFNASENNIDFLEREEYMVSLLEKGQDF
jgi:hypothetical protein